MRAPPCLPACWAGWLVGGWLRSCGCISSYCLPGVAWLAGCLALARLTSFCCPPLSSDAFRTLLGKHRAEGIINAGTRWKVSG